MRHLIKVTFWRACNIKSTHITAQNLQKDIFSFKTPFTKNPRFFYAGLNMLHKDNMYKMLSSTSYKNEISIIRYNDCLYIVKDEPHKVINNKVWDLRNDVSFGSYEIK